jgi:hypothetical protein
MRTWYDIPNGHAHPVFQTILSGMYRPTNAELLRDEEFEDKLSMYRNEY